MTEAELQRLAEIMAELSQANARPGPNFWSTLFGAFFGSFSGLGAALVMDCRRKREVRKAQLKRARRKIYFDLQDSQQILAIITTAPVETINEEHLSKMDSELRTIYRRIDVGLWNADDVSYRTSFMESVEARRWGKSPDYSHEYKAVTEIIENWKLKYKSAWNQHSQPSFETTNLEVWVKQLVLWLRGRGGSG